MSEIAHIDCGYLAVVQAMAADRWKNAANRKDYIANVNSALALAENNGGVNLVELKDSGKARKVSLEWPKKCSIEVVPCSDDCTITGTDVTPECKEYDVDCLGETTFVVNEREYRDRTMDEQMAIATNMLLHMKAMDESMTQAFLAALDANAGNNVFTAAPGNVVADLTYIGAADWNEHIFSYLALVARLNKFASPVVLDGTNLFRLWWEINKDQANADGKGAASKLSSIGTPYFDPENMIGSYDQMTYIWNAGAIYGATKTWNPRGAANAIRKAGTDLLYSLPSNNIPGVAYDILVREACSSNDYQTQVKIQAWGVFAINPTPCNDGNNGILRFKCGAPA
jgi:hypothetical protein